MSQEYNGDDTVQDAIRNMFSGSIPERKKEIGHFWSTFCLFFAVAP